MHHRKLHQKCQQHEIEWYYNSLTPIVKILFENYRYSISDGKHYYCYMPSPPV